MHDSSPAGHDRQALIAHLQEGRIDDRRVKDITAWLRNEEQAIKLMPSVERLYNDLVLSYRIKDCPGVDTWRNELLISLSSLRKACYEIEMDFRILLARRGDFIGRDKETDSPRPTRGKIAGITTYRLARAQILHLGPGCLGCIQAAYNKEKPPCYIANINTELAIRCGLYFIDRMYLDIPSEIQNELVYTLSRRHTNQETLGIVFDSIKKLHSKRQP